MRFQVAVLAAVAVATTSATPFGFSSWTLQQATGYDLSQGNHYGSPIPPWQSGHKPGWYYGSSPQNHPGIPCLSGIICDILRYFPYSIQCPKPKPVPPHTTTAVKTTTRTTTQTSTVTATTTTTVVTTATTTETITATPTPSPINGYIPTFTNISAAVQADDFLTFGLVDTIAECMTMCDNVVGCGFINSFDDVNGKDGSTLLTCSLFTNCHNATDADNFGGQSQPDGTIDFIANSNGFCKVSS